MSTPRTCQKVKTCREPAITTYVTETGELPICEAHWRKLAKLPPVRKKTTGNCQRCQERPGIYAYLVGEERLLICSNCWTDATGKAYREAPQHASVREAMKRGEHGSQTVKP